MTTSILENIESAEELLGRRWEIVKAIVPLRALYGNGSYLGERDLKVVESQVALDVRAQIETEGKKATEGAIEARVRTDPRYQAAIDKDRQQREAWIRAEEELNEIEWRLKIRNNDSHLLAAEARLTPR